MKIRNFLLLFGAFASLELSSQTTQFYCPTACGGAYGGGEIFSVDGSGNNYQKRYDFPFNTTMTWLCEGTNGKIYGTGGTQSSFIEGWGTIYEYDAVNNVVYEKYTFPAADASLNPMVLAPNNKMYGTSYSGGTYGNGFIFEYDYINNVAAIKYSFDGPVNGSHPTTKLVLASNGKLYGGNSNGANAQNEGCFFEYDYVNDVFTKKLDFDVNTFGARPATFMAEGDNQKIYGHADGTTSPSGGSVFEYDINAGTMTAVHYFNTSSFSGIIGVLHANGKIYGLHPTTGTYGQGQLFEYDYNTATFSTLWSFNSTSGWGISTLPLAINNKLYIPLQGGGTYNNGTLVSYDMISSAQTILHQFNTPGPISPRGNFIKHSSGKLFCTGYGGIGYMGQLFYADTLGNVTNLLDMNFSPEGNFPNELAYINNNLYGMSYVGGTYNAGIIYKFDPALQQYTKLWEFDMFGNGYSPKGALIPSSGNSVYGATEAGGAGDYGQVFEFDLNTQTYTPIFDMDDNTIGSYPTGYIVKHSNGKIYGTNRSGGISGYGTLFEVDPVAFTGVKRYDFANPANGQHPDGIVLGSNGKIYGVAPEAGANLNGTFFEFTPPTTFVKKFSFSSVASGDYPVGRPLEVAPGIFYGVTRHGGANGNGVLYKYKVSSNTLTKLVDFDSLDLNKGGMPSGSLTMGAGGKVYGTTLSGGAFNLGVMFEYDTLSGTLTKKLDFNGQNGRHPGSLTLVCGTTSYDAGNSGSYCENHQYVLGTTADPGYTYNWAPATGLSASNVPNPTVTVQSAPVTYTVTETYLGCVSNDMVTITPLLPQTPQICLVTDDSADVYNHVIWEKSLYSGVDSFIVYREISTGLYARIGAVSNDSLSEFIDTARSIGAANGDPHLSTYRYKISIKDTCGNEGALSPWHTSIYFNDLHNGSFQWNSYLPENMSVTPISTYELLRDSNNTGYWKVIASCAGTSNILIDPQYSTFMNTANWRVQANGITCNPTMRQGNNGVQSTIVKTKSNISNNRTTAIKQDVLEKGIGLYPNPFSDKLTITSDEKAVVTIYNALGDAVFNGDLTDKKLVVDLASKAAGVYNVVIKTDKGLSVKKIVKQ